MATDFERDQQRAREDHLEQERRSGTGLPPLAPGAGRPPQPRERQVPPASGMPTEVSPPPTRWAKVGMRANQMRRLRPNGALKQELPKPTAAPIVADDQFFIGDVFLKPRPTDQESVVKATGDGFVEGFASTLPAGSPVAGLAMIAEAAEVASASSAGVKARMARFPELQGVEVPKGNAARFPELSEEAPAPRLQEPEQDGGYDR